MRVLLLWLLLLAPPAWSQDAGVSAADRNAIAGVIQGQIEAFRRDDAASAFGYAAPAIQSMFGDPDRFMAMVRTLYPPVYRPRSVEFSALEETGGQVIQKVELTGPDGRPALALYAMERQPDGRWRIVGCSLAVSELVGA